MSSNVLNLIADNQMPVMLQLWRREVAERNTRKILTHLAEVTAGQPYAFEYPASYELPVVARFDPEVQKVRTVTPNENIPV